MLEQETFNLLTHLLLQHRSMELPTSIQGKVNEEENIMSGLLMHHEQQNSNISGQSAPNQCYCSLKIDKNSNGIIYCSEQQVMFKHNFQKLEACLRQYKKNVTQKSRKVTDHVTENKIIGMLEVWEHIDLFGGFMDLNEAWKRFRGHQSVIPEKEW